MLKLDLGDELIINDGQHRCAGIAKALKENPVIGDETISVVCSSTMRDRSGSSRCSPTSTGSSRKRPSRSTSSTTSATRSPPRPSPSWIKCRSSRLTEKEKVSLESKSTKLFTLAALYDANRELFRGRENEDVSPNARLLERYWTAVATHMPDWSRVLKGQKLAIEMRQEKIVSHSTVLRALGGLGVDLLKNANWHERLAAARTIDWSKKNPEWENICIIANSVVSNRQARAATKAFIKAKLGLALTDGEERTLASAQTRGKPVEAVAIDL